MRERNKQSEPPTETAQFDQVFRDCAPYVWRLLGRLGVPSSDVPDVAQEVFLVVHRRLADFEGRSSVRTWIYSICVLVARDSSRKRLRRRELFQAELPERGAASQDAPDAALHRRHARQLVSEALSELSEDQREVFVLYELEELPITEIAEMLACPQSTVYSRLTVARRALRASFARMSLSGREP
jgi:RNA polymerase sigma-70 factor (ECF subfamily)